MPNNKSIWLVSNFLLMKLIPDYDTELAFLNRQNNQCNMIYLLIEEYKCNARTYFIRIIVPLRPTPLKLRLGLR